MVDDIVDWNVYQRIGIDTVSFDDGGSGSGETVTHVFSNAGSYNVVLTVTDSMGESDSDVVSVLIKQATNPPVITDYDGPGKGSVNIEYSFSVNSFDFDPGDTVFYTFDWGDGTSYVSSVLAANSSFVVKHNWSKYGAYTVTVTAEDSVGASDVVSMLVLIDVIPIDGAINGYLVDEDSTDPFDMFDNSDTGDQTDVEKEETAYLIDSDDDGKWDHVYDTESGLTTFIDYSFNKWFVVYQQEMATPGF